MAYEEYNYHLQNAHGCGNAIYAAIICVLIIASLLFTSCATKTKIEYRDRVVDNYITQFVHDTLRTHTTDSVYVEVTQRNDTVYKTKYKERTQWRDKIIERHDTCWCDSIIIEYKEIVKTKKHVPWPYHVSMALCVSALFYGVYKLLRWLKVF